MFERAGAGLHARGPEGAVRVREALLRAAASVLGEGRWAWPESVAGSKRGAIEREIREISGAAGDVGATFVLGAWYERLLGVAIDEEGRAVATRGERRKLGAFYTPREVVERTLKLLGVGEGGSGWDGRFSICDLSCGSGNFLSVAARRLGERGERVEVVGIELDPLAAWACRAGLEIDLAGVEGRVRTTVLEGDGLLGEAVERANALGEGGFDVVLGNPPFLGQLGAETARSRAYAAALAEASGGLIRGYADQAAAFVWRSVEMTRPGGVVGLVLPRSILRSRDAGRLRAWVERACEVTGVEEVDGTAFDAGVSPCIVALRRRKRAIEHRKDDDDAVWGVGIERASAGPTLGEICTATADFRDAYYGLAPCVVEDEHGGMDERAFPRLISCGLIEPGRIVWGERPVTLYKRRWLRPRVDLRTLERDPAMAAWARRRLVPKVLLATQTRTIECVADQEGAWLPVTPVITIVPREGVTLERIERAMASPGVLEAARAMTAGTGLTPHVIKLSARQVERLPLEG